MSRDGGMKLRWGFGGFCKYKKDWVPGALPSSQAAYAAVNCKSETRATNSKLPSRQ